MHSLVEPGSQAEQVGRLFLAVLVVLVLPAIPFGTYLIYPFVILTTWFHEMGHGMTSILLGQDFQRLLIFSNGSGLAEFRTYEDTSPFTIAAIAAGGPLAPAMVGSGLIMASAHRRLWRPVLWGFAAAILISVIVYVRSTVGYAVLPLVGALLALLAWKASDGVCRFVLQFLGVLGAMSMLADFDYLFSENTPLGVSDTGQMEAMLLLPHWVWAIVLLAISALMVLGSLKYALNERRLRRRPPKLPANVMQFKRPRR